MKTLSFITFAAINILMFQNSFAFTGKARGFWMSNRNFERDYVIHRSVHPGRIEDYIARHNPSAAPSAAEIAEGIVDASKCMAIDPIYTLAKIHRESTFFPDATSPTGAVGLSQMTTIGIREIQDQMGMRGPGFARKLNTHYIKNRLISCMGFLEYNHFIALFESGISKIKNELRRNTRFSLFAGAILLKVYLAQAKDALPHASVTKVYRIALEQYNGEATKAAYARWIKNKVGLFNRKY